MRRRRRNKNHMLKLGSLFIIVLFSFSGISASYAHWEEILYIFADMETTEWEEKTIDPLLMVGFEDLQIAVGTGTQGYWKTHPEAWPVDEITIGGITYTKSEAIALMEASGPGDKTYDMFQQLVAAKLNVLIGCESGCIDQTIADADDWMEVYPVGSGVGANDPPWKTGGGKELHETLTNYNEGDMCAPHRDDVEGLNDYDYNDFVVNISVKGTYVQEYLCDLNFTFEAMARGASYHHTFKMVIPPGTFGTDGNYIITYYDNDGTTILDQITAPFYDISEINLTIFQNTWEALPPTAGHSWAHKGDIRFLATPNDWIWPQEYAAIWTVYPYDGAKGVQEGNPPVFIGDWYDIIPTTYKWDPFCP